jgi:hypothetical protein
LPLRPARGGPPYLQALPAATGATATLSAYVVPDAVTVDFVQSQSSVHSLNAVAAPVFGSGGEPGGDPGRPGFGARFERARMRTAVGPLLERAAAISVALGSS